MRGRRIICVIPLLVLASCGPNAREKALSSAFAALNAAHEGFVTWDAQHQQEIVEKAPSLADGQAALAKYRSDRDPIMRGFFVAYSAFGVALAENTTVRFAAALQAAEQVYMLVKKFAPGALP